MAKTILVELNRRGLLQLMKVDMLPDLTRRGERVRDAAGPGMELDVRVGRNRARATVITATDEARRAEATQRRLSSAVQAGR